MQGRLTLRERLVLLVLAAVLPLGLLSAWLAVREVDRSRELGLAQLRFAASAVAASHDRTVESVLHLLQAIAVMPEMRVPSSEACASRLAELQQRLPAYANLGVAERSGQLACIARGDARGLDVSHREYFRRALARRAFVMGEAFTGRVTGTHALAFGLPILEGGEPVAVVFATLDLRRASGALGSLDLPDGARVSILDGAGHELLVHPPVEGSPPGSLAGPRELIAAAQALAARTGEWTDPGGQRRLYAAAPTRQVGGERLLAIVAQERDRLTAAADVNLLQVAAVTLLAMLAALAAAWWVGGRILVQPAERIMATVRKLQQGRLDARAPGADRHGRGEFARIAAAFNLMADSLQLRQKELEAELARGRSAYGVLDTVLNGMQEGVIAVDRSGQLLIVNRAAEWLFPIEGTRVETEEWPRLGFFHAASRAPMAPADTPFARALRGEAGEMLVMVRNERAGAGRLVRCSYRPMASDAAQGGALVAFTDMSALEKAESDLVLLRNAIARLNDIVLITEAEPMEPPGPRIVFVNEAFERLTGYSAQEALGRTPRMLQGPGTDRAALDRIRAALQQGRPVREELLNYAKDGRAFWLELDIVPLADETGRYTHLIGVQRDITARKRFEQQLLDSERELQAFSGMLQRSAGAAQAITSHRGLEPTLQEVVAQACRVIGAAQAALVLGAQGEGAQPHGASAPAGSAGAALHAQATGLAATLARTADVPRRPALHQLAVPLASRGGQAIGVLVVAGKEGEAFDEREEYVLLELAQVASIAIENARLFEEIRELNASLESRIAERTAELVRQGRLYRALAEQLPEIVWNTDATGTRLTFLNRAWYELVGGTDNDWLNTSGMAAIHPDDRAEVAANWRRSRDSLATFTGVRRMRARDGSYHTMSYKGAPVFDENGQVAFWVGIDADITPQKVTEEALRASNQELEAFSYSVSHDLRAPLAAIDGFSRALAGRLENQADEKVRHYLARIQAGALKMEQLIEALLRLSRVAREPLVPEPVDLGACAREVLEGLRLADPAREVQVCIQEGLVAQGDARLLRIVMQNLLGNAWKFTSRTPVPRIEVGRLQEPEAFYVRDNGVGFDMAYAGKLFSAFQRLHTESEFPGTGIGLATVRRIIARHLGKVWVESQPGEGTTFYFTLPPAAPPWAEAPPA